MTSKATVRARGGLGPRLLIDFAVGVVIILGLGALILISNRTGFIFSGGWFGFLGFSPFVFWFVSKSQPRQRRRPKLWLVVGALLAFHLAAGVTVLLKYPDLRLMWFAPASIVEVVAFTAVLAKLFGPGELPNA